MWGWALWEQNLFRVQFLCIWSFGIYAWIYEHLTWQGELVTGHCICELLSRVPVHFISANEWRMRIWEYQVVSIMTKKHKKLLLPFSSNLFDSFTKWLIKLNYINNVTRSFGSITGPCENILKSNLWRKQVFTLFCSSHCVYTDRSSTFQAKMLSSPKNLSIFLDQDRFSKTVLAYLHYIAIHKPNSFDTEKWNIGSRLKQLSGHTLPEIWIMSTLCYFF